MNLHGWGLGVLLSLRSKKLPSMKAERDYEIHRVQISLFTDENVEACWNMGLGRGNTSRVVASFSEDGRRRSVGILSVWRR